MWLANPARNNLAGRPNLAAWLMDGRQRYGQKSSILNIIDANDPHFIRES